MSYTELSAEERATIQIGGAQGFNLSWIARLINRSPSTISRELRRNRDFQSGYSTRVTQQQMQARRQACWGFQRTGGVFGLDVALDYDVGFGHPIFLLSEGPPFTA